MVPAPTTASGTSAAMALIAEGDAAVRSVTSMAGRPPAASARASGTAVSRSSMVRTGTTGPSARISEMVFMVFIVMKASCCGVEDRRTFLGAADQGAEGAEQVAAGAEAVAGQIGGGRFARGHLPGAYQNLQRALFGVEP